MMYITESDMDDACDTLKPKKKEMDEAISPDFAEVIKLVGGRNAFLKIIEKDELTDAQYTALMNHFADEIPSGVKNGDDHEWIIDKLKSLGKPMEECTDEVDEASASDLTDDEARLLVGAINRLGTGSHPVADKKNLDYFKPDYIKNLLGKAKSKLNPEGQKVADSILKKLAVPKANNCGKFCYATKDK